MIFRISVRAARIAAVGFFAVLGAVVCVPLASCKDSPALPKVELGIEKLDASGLPASGAAVKLVAEVARTERDQEKGYMERKEIPDGTGMMFAYDADQQMHFWMKNTPHALSIAFIDSEGVLREIYDMEPFSLETVSSERSVRYALEVPQGAFARAGIKVGDRLTKDSLAALKK